MKNFVVITFVILFISCEKGSKDKVVATEVFAGETKENMYYESYGEDFHLSYTWSPCGYGDCLDSIDLQNDGSYDILLKARFFNPDLFGACCPPPIDCVPSDLTYKIISLNNTRIACTSIPFSLTTLHWMDAIAKSYRIDTLLNWQSNALVWSMMNYPQYGFWYNLTTEKYFAFRCGDSTEYKYGWFKVKMGPDRNLLFREYAIEE